MPYSSSLVTLAFLAFTLVGCPKPAEPDAKPTPAAPETPATPTTKNDGEVCCESFGYGSMMVKCCETYAWTLPAECVLPEGMVGGGREVVADEKCPPIR